MATETQTKEDHLAIIRSPATMTMIMMIILRAKRTTITEAIKATRIVTTQSSTTHTRAVDLRPPSRPTRTTSSQELPSMVASQLDSAISSSSTIRSHLTLQICH